MNLKLIGSPHNMLIKLSDDVLPEPDAILVHGITPQKSRDQGTSEAEFLKFFMAEVFQADTIMVGFNNIRFDDEFMRFTMWRNFQDPYEWQWKENCSKWDLLDVARMTRALRPEGIKWPFDTAQGKPSNRLELLASINKLDHDSVHDALSDVHASIAVARLLRNKQPKLFEYLLNLRDKTKVEALVSRNEPFVYTSGRYSSEYEKTTVAVAVLPHPEGRRMLVYDLRVDPGDFLKLNPAELAARWSARGPEAPYFPVKLLSYNRCPAVAPISVLDKASATRLNLIAEKIENHRKKLKKADHFGENLVAALEIMYPKIQPQMIIDEQRVDQQLYDGFVNNFDRTKMSVVRATGADELASLQIDFTDERLKLLLPLYKARNYPQSLSSEERIWWESFRAKRLLDGGETSQAAKFFKRIEELTKQPRLNKEQKFLLEELNLYGQSILPLAE